MIGIHRRGGIDLEAVVVVVGILKQAVHGVQHFVGHVKKPFPGYGEGGWVRGRVECGVGYKMGWY